MRRQTEARWSARVVLLTGLLLAATLLGAWRVSGTSSASSDREDPVTLRLGEATVAVTHVERVTGLTADDLGGMTHGIQGLVPDDQTMLRVSLMLTAGSRAAAYDGSTEVHGGIASIAISHVPVARWSAPSHAAGSSVLLPPILRLR